MASTPHRFLFQSIVHATIVLASFATGCSVPVIKPEMSRTFATRCMTSEASARELQEVISGSFADGTFGAVANLALGTRRIDLLDEKYGIYVTCCRVWVHSDVCSPSEVPVDLFSEHSPVLSETEKASLEAALEAEMAAATERHARKQ